VKSWIRIWIRNTGAGYKPICADYEPMRALFADYEPLCARHVQDPDPHQNEKDPNEKSDPDPHQSEKPDLDPHQSEKPDPHHWNFSNHQV